MSTSSPLDRERDRRFASVPQLGDFFTQGSATIHFQRAEQLYARWPSPTCIVSDGPYGLSGFPGDLPTAGRWSIGIDLTSWRGRNVQRQKQPCGFGIRNSDGPRFTLCLWNAAGNIAAVTSGTKASGTLRATPIRRLCENCQLSQKCAYSMSNKHASMLAAKPCRCRSG